MRFPRAWLGLEVRRRRRSLAVLAVLIAFSLATVLAAVAGSRRGESALDRLRAGTLPADAQVLIQDPGFDWDKVRAIPGVLGVAPSVTAAMYIEGVQLGWDSVPPVDPAVWRDVERPVLLAGRLPDPARADELAVSARFVERYGKGVGDSAVIRLATPQEADIDLGVDAANTGSTRIRANGPRVTARIVGVIRSPWFADRVGETSGGATGEGFAIPSPGLFLKYQDNFLGAQRSKFTNALVRLENGEDGLAEFRSRLAAATGRPEIRVDNLADGLRRNQRLVRYEAIALLAFGLSALVAAALVIGQFAARLVAASLAELRVLIPAGLTPRQAVVAAALGPSAAALPGAVLGVTGAALASRWTPLGAAANFEPRPGLDLDWPVLLGGLVAVLVAVAAGAGGYAWLAVAAKPAGPSGRSAVATAAGRMGWPVPVLVGLRLALERGHGRTALPVRSALIGSTVGIAGVVAALTFSAGVSDAASNPARYGQTHRLLVFLGANGRSGPADQVGRVLSVLARDPDVAGVEDRRLFSAASGDLTFPVYDYTPVGTPPPIELKTGRLPVSDREIMLAADTAGKLRDAGMLKAGVGDRIHLTGDRGGRDFTVSGIGFVPEGPSNTYSEGVLATPAGYDSLFASFEIRMGFVAFRPGADVAEATARLRQTVGSLPGGDDIGMMSSFKPRQLAEVQGVRALPVALGAFLALLALASAAYTSVTAVRRRRHDIAVLRALGMTPAQTRWSVATQAGTLAAVGLVFGVPVGLALGRVLWQGVAENTPLFYVPPVPTWTLVLIGPVTLLAMNLLAARSAGVAARLNLAHALRAE
ncbi:ABC transporter permease [Planobispora takensis]|uniref:ABC3 transporter permease protein domain-containing protein n=1 Tax=Planobispora takensis TaxID=1367882 RepID=A0A8J3SZW2_9ACTN|nr:ABC transporter permease [Planobispora takensis]GII03223.1 hypothetical protein Pta02_52310 [Planobispora takensis]